MDTTGKMRNAFSRQEAVDTADRADCPTTTSYSNRSTSGRGWSLKRALHLGMGIMLVPFLLGAGRVACATGSKAAGTSSEPRTSQRSSPKQLTLADDADIQAVLAARAAASSRDISNMSGYHALQTIRAEHARKAAYSESRMKERVAKTRKRERSSLLAASATRPGSRTKVLITMRLHPH